MTNAVKELLDKAKELETKVENPELSESIEALEYLGDDANGKAQEYKDLKEIVSKIEAELEVDTQDKQGGGNDTQDKQAKTKKANSTQGRKKLKYVGIKQIGNLWYSKQDNYTTPFDTADKCAEHFNK